jgi:hypothetical protein
LGLYFAVGGSLLGVRCCGRAVWIWSLALSLPLPGLSATYLHTAMRFVAFTACLYVRVVIQ